MPLLILHHQCSFPDEKIDTNGHLMIGAPPESIGDACESGWMNAETFLQWLQHFQQHVHSSAARPVLFDIGWARWP